MKKSKSYRSQLFQKRITALVLMVLVGSGGYTLTHLSSAATGGAEPAPTGVFNYCTLSGSTTTIYGWAAESTTVAGANPRVQVNVGGSVQTVNTDIVGYNDQTINRYLREVDPQWKLNSTYGFAVRYTNLYKGTAYGVSGSILNPETGVNSPMLLDSASRNHDDITANMKATFALTDAGTLPDTCLTARPVVAPQPPPLPPTGGGGGGGTTPTTPKPGTSGTGGNNSNTSQANATVAAGTLSAEVTVPQDGASTAYLLYGTSETNLEFSSEDLSFSGDKASSILTELQPKTKYYYQIVRTDAAGKVSSSAVGNFETVGYAISLHFQDAKNKAISGIKGVLDDADNTQGTSNKNGDLAFYDLNTGTYVVKFAYNKLTYSREFDTESISTDAASNGKVAMLKETINVATLKDGSTTPLPTKNHSVVKILLWLFFIILIGALIVWLFIRRRRRKAIEALYGGYTPTPPAGPGVIDMPTSEAQQLMPPPTQIMPTKPEKPAKPAKPAKKAKNAPDPTAPPTDLNGQPLEHVGESLREMVIRSMHEEAQKRKDAGPDNTGKST